MSLTPDDPQDALPETLPDPEVHDEGDDLEPEEELRLGKTPEGRAANDAVLALARAARSFVLYDSGNEAIRNFLAAVQDRTARALQICGTLELEVRPFDIIREREIVYQERDRERSLAFRMYRDGIRRVIIREGATWPELLKLLETLSICYSFSGRNEDDIVTLLKKAEFEAIQVDAVEGVVPDEEFPEDRAIVKKKTAAVAAILEGPHIEPPRDWDQPMPPLDELGNVAHRPIPASALARVTAQDARGRLASESVRLVALLLTAAADPTDPMELGKPPDGALGMVAEVRDYLIIDENPGGMAVLIDLIRAIGGHHPKVGRAAIGTLYEPTVLKQLFTMIAVDRDGVAALALNLVETVPPHAMPTLLEVLSTYEAPYPREIALKLITRHARAQPDLVLEAIGRRDPAILATLLPRIPEILPNSTQMVAISLASHPDPKVQRTVLQMLRVLPLGPGLINQLEPLLRSTDEQIRDEAIALISRIGDQNTFAAFANEIYDRSGRDAEIAILECYARVLVGIDQRRALLLLKDWAAPSGLLKRLVVTPAQQRLQWIAVTALGDIPTDEAGEAIRAASKRGGGDLLKHCMTTLARRHRREVRRG